MLLVKEIRSHRPKISNVVCKWNTEVLIDISLGVCRDVCCIHCPIWTAFPFSVAELVYPGCWPQFWRPDLAIMCRDGQESLISKMVKSIGHKFVIPQDWKRECVWGKRKKAIYIHLKAVQQHCVYSCTAPKTMGYSSCCCVPLKAKLHLWGCPAVSFQAELTSCMKWKYMTCSHV